MGANSMQGLACLVFLLAFVCLSASMFYGGNIILLLLFVVGVGASVPLFQKAKRLEFGE